MQVKDIADVYGTSPPGRFGNRLSYKDIFVPPQVDVPDAAIRVLVASWIMVDVGFSVRLR